ncbi:ATP-dependent zinc metalloprotease FtsH [Spirochaeta africana]|uniref:ATP-dependent zinc metalloprotease FtsH n=1 Tax=Spirochaeta africana (strain ATCC 700263 / DSM 8902 / Z-7692) TaxID=889378 RepID=H9UK85_SPIAZ|nr:ATP-dependent zinc metalloprotease FtsH [Spirochaeta africana]AFG37928.1 ATP-dependent metalloprotease FtsH [Spirochaeta africana DSM 8902]
MSADLHTVRRRRIFWGIVTGLAIFTLYGLLAGGRAGSQELTYSQVRRAVEAGWIDAIEIIGEQELRGTIQRPGGPAVSFHSRIPYLDDGLMNLLLAAEVEVVGRPEPLRIGAVLLSFLPWVIAVAVLYFLMMRMNSSGGGMSAFGKSRVKRFSAEHAVTVDFAGVAGQHEAKQDLQEVVEFLRHPQRFSQIGARIPKGVLLTGMPGTGKTLLAKAVAGEAGVAFFHISGSDFVEMFVGVGASRVRDLFETGRRHAPCIIFIDELDAVGRSRGAGYGGGHDEREQTLNQMLVEMDGFSTQDGVIIIAATNRPDVLDPALLRPGRFDRQIVVDMPDARERLEILKIHIRGIPVAPEVDLDLLSRGTTGSSGADLANLVNEAALHAARHNRLVVTAADFEEARDKVLMGTARRTRMVSPSERESTAYHEAGHALLHLLLPHADPLHKVTIVPRGRALGVAMSLPEEDVYTYGAPWLRDRIKITYGGMLAEQIVYGQTTTGVQNDLQQATELARKMVTRWGMSGLGPVAFGQDETPIFLGREIAAHQDYSEATAAAIDEEMRKILRECYQEARKLMEDHVDMLHTMVQALMEQETLHESEVRELLQIPPRTQDESR